MTWQWYRFGVENEYDPIVGATSSTFTPSAGELNHVIFPIATYHRSNYASVTIYPSDEVILFGGKVAVGDAVKRSVAISGTHTVGHKLTAKVGHTSVTGSIVTYRWYRSGKAISGAIDHTYTTTKSDKKKKISVVISVFVAGHTTYKGTSKSVTIG